jgi:hypothetical protein
MNKRNHGVFSVVQATNLRLLYGLSDDQRDLPRFGVHAGQNDVRIFVSA